MKPGSRLALRLALVAWLALVLSAGFGTPASAQKNEVAALNAGIAELSRSCALPFRCYRPRHGNN